MTAPETSDLIVVGGGINGCGIARDAARRGLSVTLVERLDIGAGTSATSTKLIHGGLRYLEYFEFALVYESLHERERLLALAPHLVHPLPFVLPVYRGARRGMSTIAAGLALYRLLSGRSTTLPHHRRLSAHEVTECASAIDPKGLLGGYRYFDAQVPYPERLCLENALDAAANGATILTRHEVTGFLRERERVVGVQVRSLDTGDEVELRSRTTINAAGPWVDQLLEKIAPSFAHRIGGTRGMHLLMPRREGGPETALYTTARSDGRPFFIVPWRDYYWVGTTDIEHENPDTVAPTEPERDYLVSELRALLPDVEYSQDDVYYAISGVRPLPAHDSAKPAAITRRHIIIDHGGREGVPGLVSIVGGKLTTYRSLAEQAVDAVYRSWGSRPAPCPTRELPLPGAGMPERQPDADPALVAHLAGIYGRRAIGILVLAARDPRLAERLQPDLPDIGAEVVWSTRHEYARHVEDVLLRRTGIGTGHTEGLGCVEKVAGIMGEELQWSEERQGEEVERYRRVIERTHRVHDVDGAPRTL